MSGRPIKRTLRGPPRRPARQPVNHAQRAVMPNATVSLSA